MADEQVTNPASEEEQNPAETVNEEETKEKMELKVTIEDGDAWKKKISFTIPRSEITKERSRQVDQLKNDSEIPGFRKGRAPRRLIEKRFGAELADQVKYQLLLKALQQIEEEYKLDILVEPDLELDKITIPDEGDFSYEYEVEVRPEFELPNLENIRVEKKIVEITEERVAEVIDNLRRRYGKMEDVEPAAKDDSLTATVTLKIDGIEEPEVLDDYPLWVSPCSVRGIPVEGIETLLEGVKVGDEKTAQTTIPEDHPVKEWRGKQVDIKIAIKSIKRLKPAELNEEFFKMFSVENEGELRSQIEETLENQADEEARRDMTQQIRQYLDEQIQFDLPEGVTKRHIDRVAAQQMYQMLSRGVPKDHVEKNVEEIRASATEEAKKSLKSSFILEKVIEKLDIQVDTGELNSAIARMAFNSGQRPEKLRDQLYKNGMINNLANQIAEEKALERVLEMAEVVDVEPAPESPGDSDAKA